MSSHKDHKSPPEILFLGTGTGVPSKERGSPSLAIRFGSSFLLFDCGPGTLLKMTQAGFSYHDPDYMVFTHFHVDHTCDVAALLFASRYQLARREKPLTLLGAPGLNSFLQRLHALYPGQLDADSYRINIEELRQEPFRGREWVLRGFALPHTPESLGYRFETAQGSVIAISGDTGYSEHLIEMGCAADILILECSFPEKVKGHLAPEEVSRIACAASPRSLVITHLYPVCQKEVILAKIKKNYHGEVTVAHDLMSITLP